MDITDRPIRTVISKNNNGFLEADGRGKHGNHKKVDLEIKEGIRSFINRIPRVESHYTRSKSTREYIEGNKSIASIYRDYVQDCATMKVPCGNSTMFHRIFNYEFNISFFSPKKDQCELCTAYHNAQNEEKDTLKVKYSVHLKEKELSRAEKERDKELAKEKDSHLVVGVFDLQAVLPSPRGEVSVFYYKSKLNSYNLTISELNLNNVECFFWHEGEGNRGAIEIGSCVYKFLQGIADMKNDDDLEVILYSDNCCGQQKNSCMQIKFSK